MEGKIEKVIEEFKSSINPETEYSSKELVKLFEEKCKSVYGGKGKKKSSGEKKAPSAYNIFIREEIARIQKENLVGVAANDFMKIAAQRWKEHKQESTATT